MIKKYGISVNEATIINREPEVGGDEGGGPLLLSNRRAKVINSALSMLSNDSLLVFHIFVLLSLIS